MQSFRIRGLPATDFQHLFSLSDTELQRRLASRVIADSEGYPCRISLSDAQPGDPLILVNYEHHSVATPYRSAFAVFVREGEQQFDEVDQVPAQLRKRVLSLRGYDATGMLRRAELVDGQKVELGSIRCSPIAMSPTSTLISPSTAATQLDRTRLMQHHRNTGNFYGYGCSQIR